MIFAQVVAKSFPELLGEFEDVSQHGLASLEQLPDAGDIVIAGYQFATGAIRGAGEAARGNQP
jgi:hypothetical protein